MHGKKQKDWLRIERARDEAERMKRAAEVRRRLAARDRAYEEEYPTLASGSLRGRVFGGFAGGVKFSLQKWR